MTDAGVWAIARALRFVGLCLFYGLLLQNKASSDRIKNLIEKEYQQP